jgi:hypothetical protein
MIEMNGGQVMPPAKVVEHLRPGIGTLGAIDYMTGVHKYIWRKELSRLY